MHTLSEPSIVATRALALGLLRTMHWFDWLQIPLERAVSRWSVCHGIGVMSKDAETSGVCMVV